MPTKTRKTLKKIHTGGKTFASNHKVSLFYNNHEVKCDVCKHNNYKETIGTIHKSKVRSTLTGAFFGETAEDIFATTSVIIYTCTICGLCKIIRNKPPIHIIAKDI